MLKATNNKIVESYRKILSYVKQSNSILITEHPRLIKKLFEALSEDEKNPNELFTVS